MKRLTITVVAMAFVLGFFDGNRAAAADLEGGSATNVPAVVCFQRVPPPAHADGFFDGNRGSLARVIRFSH